MEGGRRRAGSFSSIGAYARALRETPLRLAQRAASVSTTQEEMNRVRARSGPEMRRILGWKELVGLGLGGMLGAGVFVTTGRAAKLFAGPAVLLSYALAGFCALLSAFCYTEFAVDMPVAGGAFSYLRITFGEFAAFFTGANLIMEYVVSNAAVSRSLTAYLGAAIGMSTTEKVRITVSGLPDGFNQLDLLAMGVVLAVSLCICYSTRESSALNMAMTMVHLGIIFLIILVGLWNGEWKNMVEPMNPKSPDGFFPYGVGGVFNGAAMVYLSYIGYDAVSTMAEEVRSPATDIPIGVSGSVALVTIIYCLMAVSMSKLVPYDAIDVDAPFSSAFRGSRHWFWVPNVVGVGATYGILTSLIVSMLGQARYLCVIGRSNVIPSWFAKIHPKTATPVNSSAFLGLLTAAIALFTELNVLLDLVSIGTLFVFYMVANAVVYRRYVSVGMTTNLRHTLTFLASFSAVSLTFTLLWQSTAPGVTKALVMCGCTMVAAIIVETFRRNVSQARVPEIWGVPLMPWVPAVSIFLNIFLLGALDGASYIRFGVFSALTVLFYVLYSVHASFDADEDGLLSVAEKSESGSVGD